MTTPGFQSARHDSPQESTTLQTPQVTEETVRRSKIDFFLNNQPDALIIPILFCYKTLHVSGIFSAHHQEFSTAHSALISFMQFSDDRFQAQSGWKA